MRFGTEKDQRDALEKDGSELMGRAITVEKTKPRSER